MTTVPEDAPLKPRNDLEPSPDRTHEVVKQEAPEVPGIDANDLVPADTIRAQKEVAFYGAVANTWIATRMEVDKTLLTLSAAGLGLFLTLLTTVGVRSPLERVFYGVGTLGFASAIGLAIAIFHRNADFLESFTRARQVDGDKTLARLDRALWVSFSVGALSAMLAGASAANVKYHESQKQLPAGNQMPEGKKNDTKPIAQPPATPLRSSAESLRESVDGLQRIRPGAGRLDTGSLNGLQNLRPRPTAGPTTPPAERVPEPVPVNSVPKKDP